MAYSVGVLRMGVGGIPSGETVRYEADSEVEAVSIAAYELDAHRSIERRVATVFNAAGHLMLAYSGRPGTKPDADRA